MSNLSELLPAGAGAKSASFVASGTLGSGVTVALKANGTIEAVTETSIPDSVGSGVQFTAYTENYIVSVYHPPSGKTLVIYQDQNNSTYLTMRAGTVSGSSISFATPVVYSLGFSPRDAAYDPVTGNIVFSAERNGAPYVSIITFTGSTPSFSGTFYAVPSGDGGPNISYDPEYEVFVVFYLRSSYPSFTLFDPSTGTFGNAYYLHTSYTIGSLNLSIVYASNIERHIAVYGVNESVPQYQSRGTITVLSKTTASFVNTDYFLTTRLYGRVSVGYDPISDYCVIIYNNNANGYGAIRGFQFDASGNQIASTTETVVYSGEINTYSVNYSNASQALVLVYQQYPATDADRIGVGRRVTSLAASSAIGISSIFYTGGGPGSGSQEVSTREGHVAEDTVNKKLIVAWQNRPATPDNGLAYVVTSAYNQTNNTDFIGITDQAIADTATGAVIVQGGVSDKVSSLTTGSDYYVQADGTLSTTVSSVPAGRALSTTSILLEG